MFEWAYNGVNSSIPGNGGPECAAFLSPTTKLIESVIILTCGTVLISWGYSNISTPHIVDNAKHESHGKRILLILTTLIWGIEIGFKLASETVIYLLNPCHITTACQIYLLAAPPSSKVTGMFRIHLNFLNGAVLAFLFPVTDSRVLPFETSTYWIQHIMMLVVPCYLLHLGGVYRVERLTDMSWWAFSYGSDIFYHYIILQGIAIPSQVNLNHMLCPADVDPFHGPYYRGLAVAHQSIVSPLTSKLYCLIAILFIDKSDQASKDQPETKELLCALNKKGVGKFISHSVSESSQKFENSIQTPEVVKNGHPHRE